IGGDGGRPWQSAIELPHPSGLFWDVARGELIVSSTRTPNQVFWFRPLGDADYAREVVPANLVRPDATLLLPTRSLLLPGTLYIHDLYLLGSELFVTATGHNFIAQLLDTGGWRPAWWARFVRMRHDARRLLLHGVFRRDDGPQTMEGGLRAQGTRRGVRRRDARRGVARPDLSA